MRINTNLAELAYRTSSSVRRVATSASLPSVDCFAALRAACDKKLFSTVTRTVKRIRVSTLKKKKERKGREHLNKISKFN
jgi:hypothetical protein